MDEKKIRVGTSGWLYKEGPSAWTKVFYPPGKVHELSYYSERFDFVEINSSFYRPNSSQTALAWVKHTPKDFLFSIKLWQKFTHPKMFAETSGENTVLTANDIDTIRAGLAPLIEAEKLGCLLIQFPPGFHNIPESRDHLEHLARAFHDYPVAVELRHRSWSDSCETSSFLQELGLSWVQIDEPKFKSSIQQDLLPCGSVHYIRLHGRNRKTWWSHEHAYERYDYLYSVEELLTIKQKIEAGTDESKITFVAMNNHFRGKAVANALVLKSLLGLPISGTFEENLVSEYPLLKEYLKEDQIVSRLEPKQGTLL